MTAGSATVVNAGSAAGVNVTGGAATDTVTVVYNGDATSTIATATTAAFSATEASTVTLTVGALDTITADANITLDIADLSDVDGASITGAAGVIGAAALIGEDLTGIDGTITFDADSAGTVANGASIVIEGTSGTDLTLDTDDGDDDTDSEASITININEDDDTAANTVTLDADGFGADTITGIAFISSVAQDDNAFAIDTNALDVAMTFSGAADIELDITSAVGTIDASELSGSLTATANANVLTITGGSGDDVITSDDAVAFVLDGGAGDEDRLIIDGDSRQGTFTNFEVLTIGDDDEFLASQLSGETLVIQAITGSISIDESDSIDIAEIDMSGLTAARAADDIDIDLTQIDAAVLLGGQAITYTGWNGVDNVVATANGDTISTGAGADNITGGAGDDTITTGGGIDAVDAGAGADTIDLTEATEAVDTLTMDQGDGSDVGTAAGTFADFDVITGFTTTSDIIDVSGIAGIDAEIIVSQNGATTASNDLADGDHTDVDAVVAFLNDDATNNASLVDGDIDVVAITFSDYTALYLVDDAGAVGDILVGEVELLATVDAILVAADITV